ncbi:GGDEF domain-containing protein [Serratia liquefaciens]|jgi:diguanylate cyclase|uniref:GGDEF domain-containing protein n=1 Tax=Serratia liquefaciens TaxID=614 RepID=UPI00065FC78D|nr:GGDEF domain-containing protein [Serratia liquefaciens]MCH4194133.1 GGDEF domain-containing protein [Serratia liquefaciens]MCH4234450.1 GGDEF domain-containing protein [Serratia liquefaciens]MCH4263508.1 GGDEF domain-containing protein [Serratia liquefaciens]MCI1215724.1 GGDEF domain-containing protein [Serratia liquefaciens]MCI1234053.1 GGDEF domain-containing protein [Serratia liquefaciens]
MTYVASIPTLYSDACITYATLSVSYFALSKNAPFSYQSEGWKRIVFGLLAGLAVLFLNQDRLELSGNLHFSFAMIPMILVTFYGGAVSGLVCYLMSLAFTGGLTVDNLFIGSIIIPLLLSRVWLRKSNRVFYLTIGIIALYRIGVVWLLADIRALWGDVLLYQAVSALCLAICFHGLNFKERHIHAYFSMRDKATTDSLTHINNRASVDYRLMLQQAERSPCGLMILDLDNFKRINDTYGHLAGDLLLARVGQLLQSSVRSEDFVGRYGGEEFIVITASYDPTVIGGVAERIRRSVETTLFLLDEDVEARITVSIGASLYLPGMALDKAIEVTDEALYDAKRQGKNRVVCSRLMQLAPLGAGFRQE